MNAFGCKSHFMIESPKTTFANHRLWHSLWNRPKPCQDGSVGEAEAMPGWLRLIAIVSILVAPFTLERTVAADDQAPPRVKPESGPWTPTGSFSFEGDDEEVEKLRQSLSGIACHDLSSPQHR